VIGVDPCGTGISEMLRKLPSFTRVAAGYRFHLHGADWYNSYEEGGNVGKRFQEMD
jgi:hypothetical protein